MLSAPITLASSSSAEQLEFLSYYWGDRQDLGVGQDVLGRIPAIWRTWLDLHLHGSFFSIQFGTYCYLVLRQIQQHNLVLEQHFSFTDEINLRWLRTLTYLCVFFLLLFLVFNRGQLVLYGQFEATALTPNTPFLFMVLVIYIIGIMALRQPRIDQAEPVETKQIVQSEEHSVSLEAEPAAEPESKLEPEPEVEQTKYARSGVSLEDAQRYKIRLMETMQDKQLYLDCDLTLEDLATEAGISYHQASQVINGQLHQKFFSFVNNYRIQCAKDMLADPKTSSMPIVELALEVGFKSKSSFYDAFKKATNLTPTQFKKSIEVDS